MEVWPSSIPQFSSGNQVSPKPAAKHFQPAVGPAVPQLISTYVPEYMTFRIDMNGTDLATFKTFLTALSEGIDEFQGVHPHTGNDWVFRFDLERQLQEVNFIASTDVALRWYHVSINLWALRAA